MQSTDREVLVVSHRLAFNAKGLGAASNLSAHARSGVKHLRFHRLNQDFAHRESEVQKMQAQSVITILSTVVFFRDS